MSNKSNNKRNHWGQIFSEKSDDSLGWYEQNISYTLDFFPQDLLIELKTIFIAGAGTSQLVDALLALGHRLVVNDISGEALYKLRDGIDGHADIYWLPADMSKKLPDDIPAIDIWIDRAVLHFLIEEQDITQYFSHVHRLVKPDGYVLLAEFSESGAERCAGLPVRRYSLDAMNQRMVPQFTLLKHAHYDYITPAGGQRPYLYALYQHS